MKDYKNDPVTSIISRRIIPEKQDEFEKFVDKILTLAANFEGYMGSTIIRPKDISSQNYSIIMRFDNFDHQKKWENSNKRKKFLAESKSYEIKTTKQRVTGLEYWFNLPDAKVTAPPPTYKMAITTFIAIYPLSVIINYIVGLALGPVNMFIEKLVVALILVILMTYMAMPLLTLILKKWLYK